MSLADELLGLCELSTRLAVSRVRTDQITRRDDFPAPIADLSQGRIWWAPDVEEWIQKHRPQDTQPPY